MEFTLRPDPEPEPEGTTAGQHVRMSDGGGRGGSREGPPPDTAPEPGQTDTGHTNRLILKGLVELFEATVLQSDDLYR